MTQSVQMLQIISALVDIVRKTQKKNIEKNSVTVEVWGEDVGTSGTLLLWLRLQKNTPQGMSPGDHS